MQQSTELPLTCSNLLDLYSSKHQVWYLLKAILNSYKVAFNRMGSAIFNTICILDCLVEFQLSYSQHLFQLAVRNGICFTNLIDSLWSSILYQEPF